MKTSGISAAPLAKTLTITTLLFFFVCTLASCLKPDNDGPELQSTVNVVAVNVVNATIGLKPVGFFINSTKVNGDPLEYTQESGYFITRPHTNSFDALEVTGSEYFLKTTFTFKANTYHTIFIAGESTSITSLFTEDDLSPPPAGKAKVRFVHLSPDSRGLELAIKNGVTLFPEQAYKTASEFKTIDPGVYDLQLKTVNGTVVVEQNVTVAAGVIYTAWVKGLQAGIASSPIGLQFRAIN